MVDSVAVVKSIAMPMVFRSAFWEGESEKERRGKRERKTREGERGWYGCVLCMLIGEWGGDRLGENGKLWCGVRKEGGSG